MFITFKNQILLWCISWVLFLSIFTLWLLAFADLQSLSDIEITLADKVVTVEDWNFLIDRIDLLYRFTEYSDYHTERIYKQLLETTRPQANDFK